MSRISQLLSGTFLAGMIAFAPAIASAHHNEGPSVQRHSVKKQGRGVKKTVVRSNERRVRRSF